MPLYPPPLESKAQLRERFLGNLLAIVGDARLLWTPKPSDTTTSLDESLNAATLTADATMAAQLTALGNGYARAFDGTSNYLTTPDRANLSFGSGTADQAFSVLALANVTDTANNRDFVTKWNPTADREWSLYVDVADKLTFAVRDESASAAPLCVSNAAISQGAWHLFGATYSGVGGATAMNGVALYQDAVAVASTPTNSGAYVAMENLTAPVEIGSQTLHTVNLYQGSLALIAVVASQLSASQMWAIKRLVNAFYGLSL